MGLSGGQGVGLAFTTEHHTRGALTPKDGGSTGG